MYKAVICENQELFAKKLGERVKKEVEKKSGECEVVCFDDGQRLLERMKSDKFDMIFLDIDMPKMSGIDLADEIHKREPEANIIFVTNREDLVFKAIHYRPFRFIRKEELNRELPEAIDALLKKMNSEESLLELQTKEGTTLVPVKEILYVESCKHYLTIYTREKNYEVRDKISNYEKKLNDYGFIKIHRSYLANVRFIKAIKASGVELDNTELLPVSRDKLQEVKQQYLVYMRKFVYGNH